MLLVCLSFGGAGFTAVALLLKLPSLPNCPSMFWPLASASMRLYCAQVAAQKKTVDDLLEAIALVDALPAEHALRGTINQSLEEWTQEILNIAEENFHGGKLAEAIAIARKVPTSEGSRANAQAIEERIESWQTIWTDAEKIYKDIEDQLRQQNWATAFRHATKLLAVRNTYWETTKYQEATVTIQAARVDAGKISKAKDLAGSGGVDNLAEAIETLEEVGIDSYVYQTARKSIEEYGRDIMNLADAALEARNLSQAIAIARRIPQSTNLKEEARAFITLARAESQSWRPTVGSLENAIKQAQRIGPDNPLYSRAQSSIARWQQSIEQVAVLERARDFARTGSVSDLTSAIAQAQRIPTDNPLWDIAQEEVQRWRGDIETIQDRPTLTQARQRASRGDVKSLREAIDLARQIGVSRSLYGEAREFIDRWEGEIALQEDRPILNRAQALANSGNTSGAIEVAARVSQASPLYGEAQDSIYNWQTEASDRQNIDDANALASAGTSEGLASAIRTASQISSGSIWRSQADRNIEQWSQQLWGIAQDLSWSDLSAAIAIAEQIPPDSNLYDRAQTQIQDWVALLNAPPAAPAAPQPQYIETEPPTETYTEEFVPEFTPEPAPEDPVEIDPPTTLEQKKPLVEIREFGDPLTDPS
ncbi:chromosome segregation ATPase [Oscillatoriales cyanobacterium LEGE 11467]|uniref:Chromosome segregation ATPase n=1 Tax=Zarconia navalis LEGE 11467 TaxID=1828826 RepID=A0A928Z7M5_9CYAN|nr:hypothetical protein [Zarconia navalis]MBE9040690.1 chromosome segregation ATPase [Zarconia navalis LEGE 11467]